MGGMNCNTSASLIWCWKLVFVCLGWLVWTSAAQHSSALRGGGGEGIKNPPDTFHRRRLQALREKFQLARAKYYAQLQKYYGEEYTGKLFMAEHPTIPDRQSSIGRAAFATTFSNANVSWTRIVHKVALKVLESSSSTTSATPTFVWATGGHSASAGHGNLFNESYTNVLDRHAAPLFESIGVDFVARSYAMGGTTSAVEIASCATQIFGVDVDLLSWDYGMCDGRNYGRAEMYARRASLLPNHPAVLYVQIGTDRNRLGLAERMTTLGQAVFAMDEPTIKEREMSFPDCAELQLEQIQQLPLFVRNFRCGNAIEKGEPLCGASKWTDTGDELCEKRKFRTSWHPGFKWHAYRGHVFALFMAEVIDDALTLLDSPEAVGDPAVFAEKLRQTEQAERQVMMDSSDFQFGGIPAQPDVSLEVFYKAPNYCRTARLPAESRKTGILTGKAGDPGLGLQAAWRATDTPKEMPLVYDESHRQPCQIAVQNDFKDFFLVSGKYTDYTSLTLPSDREMEAYGKIPLKGVVAVCAAACGWHCPKDTLDVVEGVFKGQAHFTVNGERVTNVTQWDGCSLLQRSNGGHIWPSNDKGRFEIAAKVDPQNMYIRLSSIMLW